MLLSGGRGTSIRAKETVYKYIFRNSTLIVLLVIAKEEQKYLKSIIGKNEKYIKNNLRRQENRRNENRLTKKQQELLYLKKELFKFKAKCLSNRSIAKQLNINESKVRTTLKK
ncbi:response regulator transcription factor [Clostridioides difficile]|uniref:response regulator transcription factor n=1 Tax=Clostridioides difficile TaxID=1496 RepID=UPI001118DB98|nr:response regulator transcription factor [Clostridioides difficile]